MTKLKFYIFALIILFISNCSSTTDSIYNSDVSLSFNPIKSAHERFTVKIPEGWYATNSDEDAIELWLNKSDFSASIIFTQVNFNSGSIDDTQLYEFVKEFKISGSKPKARLLSEEKFYTNRKYFYAFEYEFNQTDIRRTILFSHNGLTFESTAMFVNQNQISEQMKNELFATQNSILKSLNN
ncbi:MAG: hypothetical protein Fur0015_10680 [Ignavibacteriales bacterium]